MGLVSWRSLLQSSPLLGVGLFLGFPKEHLPVSGAGPLYQARGSTEASRTWDSRCTASSCVTRLGPPPLAGVVAVSGLVASGRLCFSFSGPSVLTQGQPHDVDEALPSLLPLTSADGLQLGLRCLPGCHEEFFLSRQAWKAGATVVTLSMSGA